MKKLSDAVGRMTNRELVGLAKNRFIDEDTQIAIARTGYRIGQRYLTENSGLCTRARDLLWSYPGYVLKTQLLTYGHYVDQPEKYHELYDNYGDRMKNRSPWRVHSTFLGSTAWWTHGTATNAPGPASTPGSLIEKIYNDIQKQLANSPSDRGTLNYHTWNNYHSSYHAKAQFSKMVKHPNTPKEVLIKLSASIAEDGLRHDALRRLASMEKNI